ncbi:hypothetical protein [Streptomyces malaysiensis]|uniref:Uncharacterized protein n=1 Tax=Streptomyces malaysiensis subsp. samsunensis TaxID=459658 RepID=A0A9X2LYS5_STRMQ|nr:hypothetical protein [Streptomyces samsunensis]MCQ8832262.1 hypothetical protein [Streptomyces samsunensis]
MGDVLPRSTVANMLGRATLPREELVAAFVRARGVGPAELTVWLAVRKDLATRAGEPGAGPLPDAAAPPASGPGGAPDLSRVGSLDSLEPREHGEPAPLAAASASRTAEAGARRSRMPMLSAALGLTIVVAAIAAVLAWRAHDGGGGGGEGRGGRVDKGGSVAVSPDDAAPAPGKYRIRAVHSSLCLSEGAALRGGGVARAAWAVPLLWYCPRLIKGELVRLCEELRAGCVVYGAVCGSAARPLSY